MNNAQTMSALICSAMLAIGVTACQKSGPLEQAGENLDKLGRTIENGGKKTTADKLDDAADRARANLDKAARDVKQDARELHK